MIKRELSTVIKKLATGYPVIAVTGPRQSGKTTLVKNTFPDKPYVNLEALHQREIANTDPKGFLDNYPNGAILDEIQRSPQLLSYIQVIVDEHQTPGMFIITGSSQLMMHQAITQTLAGRIAITTLLPLSITELLDQDTYQSLSWEEVVITGFYPRIFKNNLEPQTFYRNYFQTYVERDVRDLINIKNIIFFENFLKLLVGRIGQPINMSSLSNDVGVSSTTLNEWLSILEASFVIVRLQPYFENFGKRVIKSPKIYFTDVGLACYLLEINTKQQLMRDPLRGNIFENLVILELIKYRYNQDKDLNLYYYRDNNNNEVDLIFKKSHQLIPIEIKSASTFTAAFTKSLKYLMGITKNRISTGYVIYNGENQDNIHNIDLLNFRDSIKAILD